MNMLRPAQPWRCALLGILFAVLLFLPGRLNGEAHSPQKGLPAPTPPRVPATNKPGDRTNERPFQSEARAGATHVCGTIHGVATWSKNQSPYVMDDNVFVSRDGILFIEPGVVVSVEDLSAEPVGGSSSRSIGLEVSGRLVAEGTPDAMIGIKPSPSQASQTKTYRWRGIRLTGSAPSLLRWMTIQGANAGIEASRDHLIAHCVVRDCAVGIRLQNDFSGEILHCVAAYNQWGIWCDGALPEVTLINNICFANTTLRGIGVCWDSAPYADYNLSYGPIPYWASSGGPSPLPPAPHDVEADPQFVSPLRSDFRLREKSPGLGAGLGGADMGLFHSGWSEALARQEEEDWQEGGARSSWLAGLQAVSQYSWPGQRVQLDRAREARKRFEEALEKAKSPELRDKIACRLGAVLIDLGELQEGESILKKVIVGSAFAHVRDMTRRTWAEALSRIGEMDEAIALLDQTEWPRSHVWVTPAKAKYLALSGRADEALSAIEELKNSTSQGHAAPADGRAYLKALDGMVDEVLKREHVDIAVALAKGYDPYPSSPNASSACLAIAKACRKWGHSEDAIPLLEKSVERDPSGRSATESLWLLSDILEKDMNNAEKADEVRKRLCKAYPPSDEWVRQAEETGAIEPDAKEKMILIDESLMESSVSDRGPKGSYGFGQYEVFQILTQEGYTVHVNDPMRQSRADHSTQLGLTPGEIKRYGLLIMNGRYGGSADPPIPPPLIEGLVEYVRQGGSLLVTAGGAIGDGEVPAFYNPLVSRFGLLFVAGENLPSTDVKGRLTRHPAVAGCKTFYAIHGVAVSATGGTILGYVGDKPVLALATCGKGKVVAAGLGSGFMGQAMSQSVAGPEPTRKCNRELLLQLVSYLLSKSDAEEGGPAATAANKIQPSGS